MTKALLLIDLQNDFMPGGALAVSGGNELIPIANRLMSVFDLVVATQDWHPADHQSFASQHTGKQVGEVIEIDGLSQVLWPDHCIQDTFGAQLHADLDMHAVQHVVPKGTNSRIDSYSGFFDNGHRQATGLAELLQSERVTQLVVMGLATDYCVKFTALDAAQLGFETSVIQDACRAVELSPGDSRRAWEEMQQSGVELCTLDSWLSN